MRSVITRAAVVLYSLLVAAAPLAAQSEPCRVLCEPELFLEPTVTFEPDDTVFETIVALGLSTPLPRLGVTLEAITKPFQDENQVELESELNFHWLRSEQTRGWLSSHFDVVDKFSPAELDDDARAYTHKLNFELDTAVAPFRRLSEGNWLRDVEIEGSLDYVATGIPESDSPWSFSLVFVLPIVAGR